jgi:hypothetical protein
MYETVQKEAGGRSNSRGNGRLQRCDAFLVAPINSAAEEDCEESARARAIYAYAGRGNRRSSGIERRGGVQQFGVISAENSGVSVVIRRHVLALHMCAAHSCARAAALQASAQLACAGHERVRHVALLQPFNIY